MELTRQKFKFISRTVRNTKPHGNGENATFKEGWFHYLPDPFKNACLVTSDRSSTLKHPQSISDRL